MTDLKPGGENGRLTAADLQAITFRETKGFGKGYDEDEVDAFIDRCAEHIEAMNERIRKLEEQNGGVVEPERSTEDVVLQSVSILTTAQQTADTTVKNADEYSAKVMAEARSMYEEARRTVDTLVDEAHRLASDAAEKAAVEHGELERQTVYLRVLRDSTQVQVEQFLKGLLDHVATEYGRADPAAAHAASTGRDDAHVLGDPAT